MKTKTSFKTFALILAATAFAGQQSQAVVVISDTFTRTGALAGSAADVGGTWSGSALTTNGSQVAVTVNDQYSSIVGVTLAPNSVYRLSTTVDLTAGNNDWFGIGFRTTGFSNIISGTVGSILHRQTPLIESFSQNSLNALGQSVPAGFPKTLTVQLTTGATLASSILDWEVDGSTVRSGVATDASNVNGIFIGTRTSARGTFDDVRLTCDPIPEPSSLLLLGLSSCLAFVRRR